MKGFTLIEVLVVTGICALLVVGITEVLNLGNVIFPVDLGQMEIHQQARQTMQWLTRELREGRNVQISSLTADMDRITFDAYIGAGISYYPDSGDFNGDGLTNQIVREYPIGTRRIIANSVSHFKFTRPSSVLVRIEVTTSKTVRLKGRGQVLSFPLTEQVRLRNEE